MELFILSLGSFGVNFRLEDGISLGFKLRNITKEHIIFLYQLYYLTTTFTLLNTFAIYWFAMWKSLPAHMRSGDLDKTKGIYKYG